MDKVSIAMIVMVPVGLIVALIVLVPVALRAEKKRRQELWQWAAANGWFAADTSVRPPWTARLPGRNSRGVMLALTTRIGNRTVTVAEYRYKTTRGTGNQQKTTTHYFIVVVVLLDRPHPLVAVYTRGALSRLGRDLFGDRPTATGHQPFDAQFRIVSQDANYARWLVGPQLIAAHLAGAVPFWSVGGPELLTYTPGRLRHPAIIPGLTAPLLRVADLLGR